MAGTNERNFATFKLGDNPHELAEGLLFEVASAIKFKLTPRPDTKNLGTLVGILGESSVLRENPVAPVSIDQAADWVERSGIGTPLDRKLWRPDMPAPQGSTLVMTGGVANWMDRTANCIVGAGAGRFGDVIIAVGNRIMKSQTEITNLYVQEFFKDHREYPTEAQYAETFVQPQLDALYPESRLQPFDTDKGDEVARQFVELNKELFANGGLVTFARVSTAGVQLALQMRKAILTSYLGYDSKNNPKIGVLTDTIQIARTQKQIDDPTHYQSPFTALRQIAVMAKLLHEATL